MHAIRALHYNNVIMSTMASQITKGHHCLLKCWFRRRSKKTSKLLITGLCAVNSAVTGEFPTQKASSAENVFIWWHQYGSISLWFGIDLPIPPWPRWDVLSLCYVALDDWLWYSYSGGIQWQIPWDYHRGRSHTPGSIHPWIVRMIPEGKDSANNYHQGSICPKVFNYQLLNRCLQWDTSSPG